MSAARTLQRPDERLRAGDQVGDKLIVRRELGRGASATVYEAEHCEVGMPVAVKVVHGGAREPHHIARFRREARICGRVRSAYVPQVHDVGKLRDGSPYLVMELLDGDTLESYVARGPLPLGMVLDLGQQLLRALEAVHRQNAIHRDVKPENILVTEDDSEGMVLKLVDFGISKSLDEPKSLTMDGMVLGTPHYMAPEQVRGLELDQRVDVYAFGAVLYETITGRTPYSGTTADEVMQAVGREPIIPPMVLRPECPKELDELVMRALSPEADDRPASAHEARVELEQIADRWARDSQPTPLVVPSAPASAPREGDDAWAIAGLDDGQDRETGVSPFAGTTTRAVVRHTRRRAAARGMAAALAAVGLLAGIAAAALLWDGPEGATADEPPMMASAGEEHALVPQARGGEAESTAASAEPMHDDLQLELGDDALLAEADQKPGEDALEAGGIGDASDATGDDEAEASDAEDDSVRPQRRARRRAAPRITVLDARTAPRMTNQPAARPTPSAMTEAEDPEALRRRIRERVRQAMLRDPWAEEGQGYDPGTDDDPVVRENPYGAVPQNPYETDTEERR